MNSAGIDTYRKGKREIKMRYDRREDERSRSIPVLLRAALCYPDAREMGSLRLS